MNYQELTCFRQFERSRVIKRALTNFDAPALQL